VEFSFYRAGLVNRAVIAVLVIVASWFALQKFRHPKLNSVSLYQLRGPLSDYKVDQGPQIDKCLAYMNCVLVYVAPWCPACHEFLNQYSQIKGRLESKNVGSLLIVGADENRSKEVAMKEELGALAILDNINGDFRKTNGVDSFPHFIVIDPAGKILERGSAGVDFINATMNKK
jgi:thiol-disulfide isomerase/thioredoxin